jgi:hypothetical protein
MFISYNIHYDTKGCEVGSQVESYGNWLATKMHENIEVKKESKEGGLLL